MHLSIFIASSVLLLAQPPQFPGWEKAHAHAKEGKKVKLMLSEVTVEKNEAFEVYIKDGRKETLVGSVSAVNSPATVEMSMTKALSGLRRPPTEKAQVFLKTKAAKIEMNSFKVELLPERD